MKQHRRLKATTLTGAAIIAIAGPESESILHITHHTIFGVGQVNVVQSSWAPHGNEGDPPTTPVRDNIVTVISGTPITINITGKLEIG